MKPNMWQRMDSALVPDFSADEQNPATESSRFFDWHETTTNASARKDVMETAPGLLQAKPASAAISTAYDMTAVTMADPLATLASLATWGGAGAGDVNLGGLLNSAPLDEVNPTVLTKGLIRHMLVSRGALEKEALARAMESSSEKREAEPEITPEQAERRKRRRDRNKVAATRCRQRRREHIVELEENVDRMMAEQRSLEKQVAELQREKQELEEMLARHACIHPADVPQQIEVAHNVAILSRPSESSTWQSENDWESSDDDSDSDIEADCQ